MPAAAAAATAASRRVLVVGSGVIGLRTAVELTRRNVPVVLRSPVHPLDVTNASQGAGGLWMPFHCDDPRTDRWALETLDEIFPMAQDSNNSLVALKHVVSLQRHHHGPITDDFVADDYDRGTGGSSRLPAWSMDSRLEFQNVTLEQVAWQNQVLKLKLPPLHRVQAAGYHHAWHFRAPIIDSPLMLEAMLAEVNAKDESDVDVETGTHYDSIEQVMDDAQTHGCNAVVNATGLGASALCGDDSMVGARGVLLHYDRATCVRTKPTQEELASAAGPCMMPVEQTEDACVMVEEPPWGSNEYPCYLIVRGETIVVGGTYLEGDTAQDLRPHERERLLENARLMGISTSASSPKGEWAGFRPYRPTTRCEVEHTKSGSGGIRLVHAYGTGGSGWTVYAGVANEATRLLLLNE